MERNDNADAAWHVTAEGLEHAATGYFIERAVIDARRSDGLWEWPLQLAEKAWCQPGSFADAFRAALARFGFAEDEALDRSLAVAFPPPVRAVPGGFRPLAEIISTPTTRARVRRAVVPRREGVPAATRVIRRAGRLAEVGA